MEDAVPEGTATLRRHRGGMSHGVGLILWQRYCGLGASRQASREGAGDAATGSKKHQARRQRQTQAATTYPICPAGPVTATRTGSFLEEEKPREDRTGLETRKKRGK